MSLSQSAIQTWFECPRKWRYTYLDKVESVAPPSKEQRFGTGFHKLLEQWWMSQPVDWSQVELDGDEKAAAAALLEEYGRLYRRDDVEGHIGAEIPFQLQSIHGIFDAVYREPTGGIVIVEHKTTKSDFTVDEFYWERVKQAWQVGMYQLAAREVYKTDDVTVLYDVIRVPQLRQKKGESASEFRTRVAEDIAGNTQRYFGQALIKWSDQSLARLGEDLTGVAVNIGNNMLAAADSTAFPRSRKCHEYRRACEFIPVCFGSTELTDERLYRIRSRR